MHVEIQKLSWGDAFEGYEQARRAIADPILLQRLSKNLFVVIAAWNTTPLERSILRGMYS
jgi:hypothetical protein